MARIRKPVKLSENQQNIIEEMLMRKDLTTPPSSVYGDSIQDLVMSDLIMTDDAKHIYIVTHHAIGSFIHTHMQNTGTNFIAGWISSISDCFQAQQDLLYK